MCEKNIVSLQVVSVNRHAVQHIAIHDILAGGDAGVLSVAVQMAAVYAFAADRLGTMKARGHGANLPYVKLLNMTIWIQKR